MHLKQFTSYFRFTSPKWNFSDHSKHYKNLNTNFNTFQYSKIYICKTQTTYYGISLTNAQELTNALKTNYSCLRIAS